MSARPVSSALITGAGGFIGSHLTARLLAQNWQVTTATRQLSTKPAEVQQVLTASNCRQGDLGELLVQGTLNQDFDYVFHLAGSASVPDSIAAPAADLDKNAGLTLSLLENLRQRQRPPKLIYVSSAAVYGNPERMPIQETDPLAPISPYAVSKLASESYARVFNQIFALPTVILRPFSVYGPGQTKLVIYDLLKQLQNSDDILHIRGDGTQSRDFIHVNDVVDAMLLIAEKAAFQGEAYNIASGRSVTVKELASLLLETSGQKRQIIYSDKINAGEPLRWQVDIAKLQALGFASRISLRAGLLALHTALNKRTAIYQSAENMGNSEESFALPRTGEASCPT